MSMNLKKIIGCLCGFWFAGVSSLQSFPFIPLSLAALGLPLFGGMAGASSTKGNVKRTLANVDGVVGYVKLFLVAMTVTLFFILLIVGIRALKRYIRRKKLYWLINLLYRIQSDLVLIKGGRSLSENQLGEIESSKKEAISIFKNNGIVYWSRFFRKNLGFYAYNRIIQACQMMENGKISVDGQMVLVEQWLKTFDLLYR